MPKYRITGGPDGTAGLNYKVSRAEPGDVVEDIPRESIKWLREQGYIEPVGKDAGTDPVSPADGLAAPAATDPAADGIAVADDPEVIA